VYVCVCVCDIYGDTPLHMAVCFGYYELCVRESMCVREREREKEREREYVCVCV